MDCLSSCGTIKYWDRLKSLNEAERLPRLVGLEGMRSMGRWFELDVSSVSLGLARCQWSAPDRGLT